MAKIKINFLGIGLCYQKDGETDWKFIFPFDEKKCHAVSFSAKANDGTYIVYPKPLAEAGRNVVIRAEGYKPPPPKSPDVDFLLDLTANYTHSDGIDLAEDWPNHGVFIRLENAQLFLKEMTESRYVLTGGGNPDKLMGKIGFSTFAEIDLEEGGQVVVEANGERLFPPDGWGGDKGYELTIDNTCYDELTSIDDTSDFKLLYLVIKDINNPGRQFSIDRYPDDEVKSNFGEKLSGDLLADCRLTQTPNQDSEAFRVIRYGLAKRRI